MPCPGWWLTTTQRDVGWIQCWCKLLASSYYAVCTGHCSWEYGMVRGHDMMDSLIIPARNRWCYSLKTSSRLSWSHQFLTDEKTSPRQIRIMMLQITQPLNYRDGSRNSLHYRSSDSEEERNLCHSLPSNITLKMAIKERQVSLVMCQGRWYHNFTTGITFGPITL